MFFLLKCVTLPVAVDSSDLSFSGCQSGGATKKTGAGAHLQSQTAWPEWTDKKGGQWNEELS